MGTNFYWIIDPKTMQQIDENDEDYDDMNIEVHIGKRSFAGACCEDCGILLTEHGTQYAHSNKPLNYCPSCLKPRDECSGVSSFTWTMMKHKRTLEYFAKIYSHFIVCKNEYGDKFTASKMLAEAEGCIEFQNADCFC